MARKGSERRQHPRVDARLAMQLDEESLGQSLVTTESMNISRGGVYCECPEFMAPLSKVALTVILPAFGGAATSRMLRSEGVVVRCEPLPPVRGRKRYQLACCFTGLDAGSRAMLDEFVAWRAVRGRADARRSRVLRPVTSAAKKSAKKAKPAKAATRTVAAKTTKSAKTAKPAKTAKRGATAKGARRPSAGRSGTRTSSRRRS